MTSLSFVPLSLIDDDASLARQLAPAKPPIIFGREAVFIDAEASALPAMRGSPPLSPPWEISTGNILAAVVQKGRLFQRAHPDVTVIRDRGRFLLVELPPGHPILSEKPTEPCFSAYRLEPGAEVFRDLDPASLRTPRDPAVDAVLEQVSVKTFRRTLEDLTGLRTRLSTSDPYREAVRMCRERLEALGYSTTIQEFDMKGGTSCNVLAMPPGAGPVSALVTGHLDSVNHVEGPDAPAPGADDNGSGSAGVIAMAEALVAIRDRMPVGFVLFGGEEQGLLGSTHFLSQLPGEERAALQAIVNMDMIGNLNPQPDGDTGGTGRYDRGWRGVAGRDRRSYPTGGDIHRPRGAGVLQSVRERPCTLHPGRPAGRPDDRGRRPDE